MHANIILWVKININRQKEMLLLNILEIKVDILKLRRQKQTVKNIKTKIIFTSEINKHAICDANIIDSFGILE